MASTSVVCLAALLVCLVAVNGAPQFGGSFSQANAQAGAFGGGQYRPGFGQGPPGPYGYGPSFGGPGGFRRPGFGGLNRGGGGSISISKSISISRGGAGGSGAQSSASSNAGGFGK